MALLMQLVEAILFIRAATDRRLAMGTRLRPVMPSQAALLIGNTRHNIAALL